jgi:hypothetical protein
MALSFIADLMPIQIVAIMYDQYTGAMPKPVYGSRTTIRCCLKSFSSAAIIGCCEINQCRIAAVAGFNGRFAAI